MKKLAVLLILMFVVNSVFAQDITKGLWWNEEKEAKIQFFEQNGKLYGKLVWLKEEGKTDKNNPKVELRNKPLNGLVFLKNFEKDGKNWKGGEIYDPKSGKTYSSNIKWDGDNKLNIRGYVGVAALGKTTKFTRVD